MWPLISIGSLALMASVVFADALLEARNSGAIDFALRKAGVSLEDPHEVEAWLLVPRAHALACAPIATLWATATIGGLLGSGWRGALSAGLGGAFTAWVAAVGGATVGAPRGSIHAPLQVVAARAEARAREFGRAGDPARAGTAGLIAQRLRIILLRCPSMTYAGLQAYYPPTEVAAILWAYYFEGSDDYDLGKWLARPATPFWLGEDEERRCALLNAVREELLAGGGVRYADRERVKVIIAQLYTNTPAAT